MKVTAFSFFDSKVGVFHPPFFFLHRGQALRAAQELAGDMSTSIGRHPHDFVLFEVGIFDDQTGSLESITPVNLGVLAGFLARQQRLPFPHNDEANGFVDDTALTSAAAGEYRHNA